MRRALLILAITLALGLAACAASQDRRQEAPPPGPDSVKLAPGKVTPWDPAIADWRRREQADQAQEEAP